MKAKKKHKTRGRVIERTSEKGEGQNSASVDRLGSYRETSVDEAGLRSRSKTKGAFSRKDRQTGRNRGTGDFKREAVTTVDAGTGEVRRRVKRLGSKKQLPNGYTKDKTRTISKKRAAKKVARMEKKIDRMNNRSYGMGGKLKDNLK